MADEKRPAIKPLVSGDAHETSSPDSEMALLKAKLAETESKLTEAQKELNGIKTDRVKGFQTTTTKKTYKFRVTGRSPRFAEMPPLEGNFVDESEAKRCWFRMHNLDTTADNPNVVCLSPERGAEIIGRYKGKVPEDQIPQLL